MMTTDTNPLLETWTAPFGLPPFDRIKPEHFAPAFAKALVEARADLAAIAANPAPADFDNTLLALEKSGWLLERTTCLFDRLTGSEANSDYDAARRELMPQLTAFNNEMYANDALFARIKTVWQNRAPLTPQQQRLTEKKYNAFVKFGADLPKDKQARFAEINLRLSDLSTRFTQNLRSENANQFLVLETSDELVGLPESFVQATAQTALGKGMPGKHVATCNIADYETFMTFSARRDLRERYYKMYKTRGGNDNEADNRDIVAETMALRRELAGLMGYASYADYWQADKMAGNSATVRKFLDELWQPTKATLQRERDELSALAANDGINEPVQIWDFAHYTDKARQHKFALSDAELRPYLALDNVLAAVFHTAYRLFGVTFAPREDLAAQNPDIRLWEVTDADGEHISLLYGDFFSRPNKNGGAWHVPLRPHNLWPHDPHTPINTVNLNFSKPPTGQPCLLSLQNCREIFHEMGHALHSMLSRQDYPSISGTLVLRDFVELPSQLMERWAFAPEIANQFYRHHQTGEKMPRTLQDKIEAASRYGQGYITTLGIASSMLDQIWHGPDVPASPAEAEATTNRYLDAPGFELAGFRSAHFAHMFNPGYTGGFYGYLWADRLVADAFMAFVEAGDNFDPTTAAKLKEYIYTAGDSAHPQQLYRHFRGRDAETEALLAYRGLTAAAG